MARVPFAIRLLMSLVLVATTSAPLPVLAHDAGAADMDLFVGDYQLAPTAVLAITRDRGHLFAQLTGQSRFEIFPKAENEFFYKVVDAQIRFQRDATGGVTGLVLHQHGMDRPAPRIDGQVAQQLSAAVESKVRNQTATPGSEAALRRLIDGIRAGQPNYPEMSADLAKATRDQLPRLQPSIAALGEVRSVTFQGVGNQGWDVYFVSHERGSSQWRILLDSRGVIAGALVTAGP